MIVTYTYRSPGCYEIRTSRVRRSRLAHAWGEWTRRAKASGIAELRACQGQTEGRVNKLKLVKRSMYGWGKFDLLRQRVLYATS